MEDQTAVAIAKEIAEEMFPNWQEGYHYDLAFKLIDLIKAVIKEEGEQK